MIVFEILRFCRITFQFSTFSSVLQRFSLLVSPVHVVRKTFVKHTRMSKTEKLYDKISKSQILSFTIWNTPLTLHAHQISARSEHSKWCTGERNLKPTIFLTYYRTCRWFASKHFHELVPEPDFLVSAGHTANYSVCLETWWCTTWEVYKTVPGDRMGVYSLFLDILGGFSNVFT